MSNFAIAFIYINLFLDVVVMMMLLKTMNYLKSLGATDKPNKNSYTQKFRKQLSKAMNISDDLDLDDDDDIMDATYRAADDKDEDDFSDDLVDYSTGRKSKVVSIDNSKMDIKHSIHYGVINNIDEFMQYVSARNLNVINTLTGIKRTIKYLDQYDDGNGPTVLITFMDGTQGVFAPGTYAKTA